MKNSCANDSFSFSGHYGYGEQDNERNIKNDVPIQTKKATHYSNDYEGCLFKGEDREMMNIDGDFAASRLASIPAPTSPEATMNMHAYNSVKQVMQCCSTHKPEESKHAATRFSYDSACDFDIQVSTVTLLVNSYLIVRAKKGVAYKFCTQTAAWHVALLHGTQNCSLSLYLIPSGSPTLVKLAGKFEGGDWQNFDMIFNEVAEYIKSTGASEPQLTGPTDQTNYNFFNAPERRVILDQMIQNTQCVGDLRVQVEAVRSLCDLAHDVCLAPLLHDRKCTQALISVLNAVLSSAADFTFCLGTVEHSPSAICCPPPQQEFVWLLLITLSCLSNHPDALLAINQAGPRLSELFKNLYFELDGDGNGTADGRDSRRRSAVEECEYLRRGLLRRYCENVLKNIVKQEKQQQQQPRFTRSGKNFSPAGATANGRDWTEQLSGGLAATHL